MKSSEAPLLVLIVSQVLACRPMPMVPLVVAEVKGQVFAQEPSTQRDRIDLPQPKLPGELAPIVEQADYKALQFDSVLRSEAGGNGYDCWSIFTLGHLIPPLPRWILP